MVDYVFGSAPSRIWKRKHMRDCGQSLIPAINRDEVDKILNIMEAAIEMGRKEMFEKWQDLAYAVGLEEMYILPRR